MDLSRNSHHRLLYLLVTLDRDDFKTIRVIVRDEVSRAVTRALRSLRSSKTENTSDRCADYRRSKEERGEPGALMTLEEAEEDGRRLVEEVAARLLAKARRAPPKKRRRR